MKKKRVFVRLKQGLSQAQERQVQKAAEDSAASPDVQGTLPNTQSGMPNVQGVPFLMCVTDAQGRPQWVPVVPFAASPQVQPPMQPTLPQAQEQPPAAQSAPKVQQPAQHDVDLRHVVLHLL